MPMITAPALVRELQATALEDMTNAVEWLAEIENAAGQPAVHIPGTNGTLSVTWECAKITVDFWARSSAHWALEALAIMWPEDYEMSNAKRSLFSTPETDETEH